MYIVKLVWFPHLYDGESMRKKINQQVKKKYALPSDAQLEDEVKYLCQCTGMSRIELLRKIIEPFFEVGSTYRVCTFEAWSSIKDRSIVGQFYGAKKDEILTLQEIPERLSLGEKTNETLNDKIEQLGKDELARNSAKKKGEKA